MPVPLIAIVLLAAVDWSQIITILITGATTGGLMKWGDWLWAKYKERNGMNAANQTANENAIIKAQRLTIARYDKECDELRHNDDTQWKRILHLERLVGVLQIKYERAVGWIRDHESLMKDRQVEHRPFTEPSDLLISIPPETGETK